MRSEKEFTLKEIRVILDHGHWGTVNKWLARGDGIAVYRNQAMDSSNLGHRQFVSYGSRQAQLDMEDPPQRLPDIGGQINWPYQLEGIYWGPKIEHDKDCRFVTDINPVGSGAPLCKCREENQFEPFDREQVR